MEVSLLSSNKAAANSLVSRDRHSCTDHAWENLAEVRAQLLSEQAAGTRKLKVDQAGCASLKAAGCFKAGLMTEVISFDP